MKVKIAKLTETEERQFSRDREWGEEWGNVGQMVQTFTISPEDLRYSTVTIVKSAVLLHVKVAKQVNFNHYNHTHHCRSCQFSQFSSVAPLCQTLCNSMNHSMPGRPVHDQFQEFTQTHVHRVSDATQPSHPLLTLSPPAPIPPSIRVFSNESTLCMRWPKYWSFSFSITPSSEHPGLISFGMDWLISLQSKGLSRVFSNTTDQKHQFFGTQLSSLYKSHIHT